MRARLWSQPAGQGGERHLGSGQRPGLKVGVEGSAPHTRESVECRLERCVPKVEAGSQRTWGLGGHGLEGKLEEGEEPQGTGACSFYRGLGV